MKSTTETKNNSLDSRKLMALTMFIRTTIHKKPPKLLKQFVQELKPMYWKLFVNNNNKLLEKFFAEDLIKELWRCFPLEK